MYYLVVKLLRVGTDEIKMAINSFMRSVNTGEKHHNTRKRPQKF